MNHILFSEKCILFPQFYKNYGCFIYFLLNKHFIKFHFFINSTLNMSHLQPNNQTTGQSVEPQLESEIQRDLIQMVVMVVVVITANHFSSLSESVAQNLDAALPKGTAAPGDIREAILHVEY